MLKYTTINSKVVSLNTLQSDMKAVTVDGVPFGVAIKTNDGVILDHVKTSSNNDGTIFPTKSNGAVVKTWKETAKFVGAWVDNEDVECY